MGANRSSFVKGDKRINRKGRPKSFDQLRVLAQQIAHEAVDTKQGKFSTVEVIMRQWATSKDPRLQQAFINYAFGSPPTKTEVTGANGEALAISVEYINAPYPVTGVSSSASDDTPEPKEI